MRAGERGQGVTPDDLCDTWDLTGWALIRRDWPLHIALATYPAPQCFDEARRYEAKSAEVWELRRARNTKKRGKKVRGKAPLTEKQLEMEL